MSILIKGMDMPISCEKCPLCYDYLYCSIDDSLHMFLYNRHPNCPLVEIPKPHGRLIDGDKIMKDLEEWKQNPNNDDEAVVFVNHFQGIIRTEPTILEAEV